MDLTLLVLAIMAITSLLVLLLVALLKISLVTVPEEERLVIYRWGHFHRVVGPGNVLLLGRLETIERRLGARTEPGEFQVSNLFINGVPLGLTFNLWSRFDPIRAADRDKDKLKQLAMLDNRERKQQMAVKIRNAVVHGLSKLEQSTRLSGEVTFADKILPIFPGTPEHALLLDRVKAELKESLPSLGVYLNEDHPITATGMEFPPKLVKAFDWRRFIDALRERTPNMSDDMLAQVLLSIEGLDLPQVQKILWESNADARVQTKIESDGRTQVRVTPAQERVAQPATASEPQRADDRYEQPVQPTSPEPSHRLDERDLSFLKRVPRSSRGQRSAA